MAQRSHRMGPLGRRKGLAMSFIKGKTYRIDYDDPDSDEFSYHGLATFVSDVQDASDAELVEFICDGDTGPSLFERKHVSEVKP